MHGAARDLHRRFIRLGPRIAEIDLFETGQRRQLSRDALLPRNAIEIGGMPQLASLLAKRVEKEKADPELVPETLHVEVNIGDSDDEDSNGRSGCGADVAVAPAAAERLCG